MRNITYSNGEIYHLFNHGVSQHPIFLDDTDRIRFLKGLMLFNSEENLPGGNALRKLWEDPQPHGKPLVDILAYTLMDNHYHLVLEQLIENGIAKFMHRLSTGFTKYHNTKNETRGVIFESKYKAVHIQTDAQFIHISRYVHLNPYDYSNYSWREGIVNSPESVKKVLRAYPWSSYRHYLGLENNPIVKATRILNCFNGPLDYENFVLNWTTRNPEILVGLTIDEERG